VQAEDSMPASSNQAYICVCCHSNETRAPIANPSNSTQLFTSYIRVRAVVWECGKGHTDRHTHTDTQKAVANTHFASTMPHAKEM